MTVTKEMCGLKGAAKTNFDSSISLFTQQVTYISKLVGKANETLHAMALVGHLLEATNPETLQNTRLTVSVKLQPIPTVMHHYSEGTFSCSHEILTP